MRIFLSYSSDDRARAEEISLALEGRGHDVFFDRADLNAGEDYNTVIRDRLERSDLFIFLISPRALRPGAYTLTELRMAREKWPHPKGRVLPVLIEPTPLDAVPAYLRSVTLFEPEGNIAAEVAAHVAGRRRRMRPLTLAAAAAALAAVVAIPGLALLRNGAEPAVTQIDPAEFVIRRLYPPEEVERTAYSTDSSPRFRDAAGDMVTVERIAFGTLAGDHPAFRIDLSVENTTPEPIALDITRRFFELRDNQGRRADLVYFCCAVPGGDFLGSRQSRTIQLIFRVPPSWYGKDTQADRIDFNIHGLLPLVRGTWSVRPLATAA